MALLLANQILCRWTSPYASVHRNVKKNKQLPSPADSGASACYTISSNIGRCVITEADLVLIIR